MESNQATIEDVIREKLQECIEYGMGYVCGRHNLPSIEKQERQRPDFVTSQMKDISQAFEMERKEIADLKTQISTLQRFRIEDAASAMDDYNKLHSEFTKIRAQLDEAVKALEKFTILNLDHYKDIAGLIKNATDTITKLKGE